MRHGALFNGIGGFQLAAHWMGWENVFHSEINEFCNKVIKQHFPNSIQYGDIYTTDFSIYNGCIDLITGGFPCQPFSTAGKRKGKEDDRYLWPQMFRAVRQIRPRWVVCENVRGLVNWNGGMVFNEVQADLENEGYEITSYLLPACAVNAPHRRDRIWIIAYAGSIQRCSTRQKGQQSENGWAACGDIDTNVEFGAFADANSSERRKGGGNTKGSEKAEGYFSTRNTWDYRGDWQNFPSQSPFFRGNDGVPDRVDRTEALGNAIVPHVAFNIFTAIDQFEKLISSQLFNK